MINNCFKCSVTLENIKELGLDTSDIQSLLGYSYNQAYRIMSGRQNMNQQAAELLLIKLGMHPNYGKK